MMDYSNLIAEVFASITEFHHEAMNENSYPADKMNNMTSSEVRGVIAVGASGKILQELWT
ncbi:hypothetical protein [Nitrosomonas ureae]|uniref:Uncharacterized protein n=1 Tax=Nitrosomonas ureae TaxID=44577 RepID=A0A1H5WYK6_9PROT|nr:hypothetical protein [Nitrosomonas ureae]SEG04107.1 hypothetical protein SAMN05216334_12214 [Nitrosomonas ureae]